MLIVVRHGLETGLQILNVTMLVFEGGLHVGTDSILIAQNGDDVSHILIHLTSQLFALMSDLSFRFMDV